MTWPWHQRGTTVNTITQEEYLERINKAHRLLYEDSGVLSELKRTFVESFGIPARMVTGSIKRESAGSPIDFHLRAEMPDGLLRAMIERTNFLSEGVKDMAKEWGPTMDWVADICVNESAGAELDTAQRKAIVSMTFRLGNKWEREIRPDNNIESSRQRKE